MTRTGRPKSDNPKTQRVSLRIEKDLYSKFTSVCEAKGLQKSTVVRNWIIKFLEENKKA